MFDVTTVKKAIFETLRINGFIEEGPGALDSFDFKVIRSKWTPLDGDMKFETLVDAAGNVLPESEAEKKAFDEFMLSKEQCQRPDSTLLPRIVTVRYVETPNKSADSPVSNRPPIGNFKQRGMVINLETSEILYPGSSWIEEAPSVEDFNDLYEVSKHFGTPAVQKPIEGASISMLYCREVDEIFIGTNRRVLKLSKILHGSGSRWNFCGRSDSREEQFNIHAKALYIFTEIAMDHLGMSSAELGREEMIDFINMIFRQTFFPFGKEDVVYTGIISGRPFANQSQTMTLEDYESFSFTLNGVLRRSFDEATKKTLWAKDENDYYSRLFLEHSLNTSRFTVEMPLTEETHDEDVLLMTPVTENGTRSIYRHCSPLAAFREHVIRGGNSEEIADIRSFFPLHRNRKQGTPANIRERIHQIITLSVRSSRKYAFDEESMLGSPTAVSLRNSLAERIRFLCVEEMRETVRHWEDVAYPLSDFLIPDNVTPEKASTILQSHGLHPGAQRRIYTNRTNRRLCNSLAVLFSCVSVALKEIVVDEIARFFISRMLVASAAFLPPRLISQLEAEYMQFPGRQQQPDHVSLPIGIHKLRQIIPPTEMAASKRKYMVAERVCHLSFLDVRFIMGFVNYRNADLPRYRPITFN